MFQVNLLSKRGRKKRRQEDDRCRVCDGPSVGINFGVHSCSPCKAFFRRNAVKLGNQEFICVNDGDCPVTSDTRRHCNCCRLAKCFRVGMNRNSIRTDDQRLERNRLVEYNRQKRAEMVEQIQPLNLLKHASNSYISLSPDDQTLLTNIFHAYEQTCISLRYDEHYKIPRNNSVSLEETMNSVSHMYIALIDYFKLIPDFANLCVDTRIHVLRRNCNQIFRLNSSLIVHATGVVENVNAIAISQVFPADLYFEMCRCTLSLFPFVYDPLLLKLLFVVLLFSTGLTVRNDDQDMANYTEQLFHTQNFYIELLWRYISYRCSSLERSVQLLMSFMTRLLYSQKITEKLNQYISTISLNQVDQLEPIMRAMWIDEKDE